MEKIIEGIVDRQMDIITLYNCVAIAMGYIPDDVEKYGCTHIDVATNIADNVENWYKEKYEPEIGDNWRMKFGMEWCCYGPKTDDELEPNSVRVEDGFIQLAGEEE